MSPKTDPFGFPCITIFSSINYTDHSVLVVTVGVGVFVGVIVGVTVIDGVIVGVGVIVLVTDGVGVIVAVTLGVIGGVAGGVGVGVGVGIVVVLSCPIYVQPLFLESSLYFI